MAQGARCRRGGDPPLPPDYYPPSFEVPFTGQPDSGGSRRRSARRPAVTVPSEIHSSKGGPGIRTPLLDTGERYDCVIVGGGASGISAAKSYLDRFGADKRILMIDPFPDFGGHSHRNQFHIPNAANGRRRDDAAQRRHRQPRQHRDLGPGRALRHPRLLGAARDRLPRLGRCRHRHRHANWQNGDAAGIPARSGSISGCSSGLRVRHRPVIAARNAGPFAGQEPGTVAGWTAFLARTPYSQAAREGILRVQTAERGLPRQRAGRAAHEASRSASTSPRSPTSSTCRSRGRERRGVLRGVLARIGRPARRRRPGGLGRGLLDPRPPGFPDAIGLGDIDDIELARIGRTPFQDSRSNSGPTRAWPDGNTSLLRLALSKLIPTRSRTSTSATARRGPTSSASSRRSAVYDQLDLPTNAIRIRLNSTVFNVEPATTGGGYSPVDYVMNNVDGIDSYAGRRQGPARRAPST